MLRIMLISIFDFRYIYVIYIYIYDNHKTLISTMVAHAITTIYIIVIEVSWMHLLLCAIHQNQKGVWLVCLFFNKFQYQI